MQVNKLGFANTNSRLPDCEWKGSQRMKSKIKKKQKKKQRNENMVMVMVMVMATTIDLSNDHKRWINTAGMPSPKKGS